MKYLLLLLLTLSSTFGFTQPKVGKQMVKTNTIYILDKSWAPRGATKFKTDESSYLQIDDKYFVLSERTRGVSSYFEGDIETIIETNNGIHFCVRGRGLSNGKPIISCDIEPNGDKIKIHLYHALGRYDKYYSAHLATQEEIQKLLEYNIKD